MPVQKKSGNLLKEPRTLQITCGGIQIWEIRLQMMLDDSKDEVIKFLKSTLKTEKIWKVKDTIRSANDNLAFKEIIGHTQTGRQGFRTNEKQWSSKTSQDIVIQDLRSKVDNKKIS